MSYISSREYENALQDGFGLSSFKSDEQKYAVECILSEQYKNIIISMATQAGKSLCYQLPRSFKRNGVILVISPNITLITNQVALLTELRIPATSITSVTPRSVRSDLLNEFYDFENNPYQFLYATPEMIINGSASITDMIDYLMEYDQICQVVVDEAHLVVDVGFSFRSCYSRLRLLRQKYPDIPWVALTTASKTIMSGIALALSMSDPKLIKGPSVRKNIFLDVKISTSFKIRNMIEDLIELDEKPEKYVTKKVYASGVIYCGTYLDVEKVVNELREASITCDSIYGTKKDCNLILKNWKDGKFPILVATEESFGLGIRRTPLQYVVHLSHPKNLRALYQQFGRIDVEHGYSRVVSSGNADYFTDMQVFEYINHRGCRHQFFATYFGDEDLKPCGKMCDNCILASSKKFHKGNKENLNDLTSALEA